jgi:hypothetical protein
VSVAAAMSRPATGHVLTVSAYTVLGTILIWTRFVGLGRSLWFDEIVAVTAYVRPGLHAIVAGGVNHELFTLLQWGTTSLVGESEIALRVWSVVPFVLGVTIVTTWLHRRVDQLSGLLFLFLATVSPLLLDITPQARGYGLAFLAMSVMVVAGLEAQRTGRTAAVVAFCAGGLAGTWTLPNFGLAFFATFAVLLFDPVLRRRAAIGLVASTFASVAWYMPHLSELRDSSQLEYGMRIGLFDVITAPIDQILIPSLIWIDGVLLVPGLVWLPVVGLAVLFMAASPLFRVRSTAMILISGVLVTVLLFWAARIYFVPRYLSYLLVPLYMLLASGMASILLRDRGRPLAVIRSATVLVTLTLLTVGFVRVAVDVTRLPREANRDAAEIVMAEAAAGSRIVVYTSLPRSMDFYLDRPVEPVKSGGVASAACDYQGPVALVHQPFGVKSVDVPCLRRPGVRHYRVEQYTRGNEINVWLIPAPGRQ